MGMGFAPTWLRPASHDHCNHCANGPNHVTVGPDKAITFYSQAEKQAPAPPYLQIPNLSVSK